jgi:hypothetical protein
MAELPEAPRYTPPEVAQVVAERSLRSQHKYISGWSRADQRDENAWTIHDNEHAHQYGYRYATCPFCHPKEGDVLD